jgi:hypothetical protein
MPRNWFAALCCTIVAGCVRLDESHCDNLAGAATCIARDPMRPICSACTAKNDGCVAELEDAECRSIADGTGTTTADDDATFGDGDDAADDDPSVSTDPSGDDDGPATADDASTAPSTSGEVTAETDVSSDAESDGGETSSGPTSMTTDEGDAGSSESTGGAYCGDDVQQGDEECDGPDLNGQTCLGLPAYAGGTLGCDQFCMYNATQCTPCVGLAGGCATDQQCCAGAHCNLGLCVL